MKRKATSQQGMALIEALIASAVLGIGLVGATQLTLKTLNTASQNRQHTVAQHLAQDAMDCLHVQARTGAALCPPQETLQLLGVSYKRQARSKPRGDGALIDLHVQLQWAATGASKGVASEHRIDWHSSASSLPGWVGVSSP